MLQRMKEIYCYREMLLNLVVKELRARYKGSVLGFFWSFLNPLLMLIVYSVIFSFLMRTSTKNYAMFLFVALLPWNYLANSVMQGAGSLVYNSSLVKKVYFPREVLPLAVVSANMVNYLLSLLILVPALLVFRVKLTVALFAFPVVLLLQTFLVLAMTLLVSIGNVYFRDLEHITGVLITVWFFLTPVLYSAEMMPEKVQKFFLLNPAAPLIEAYREMFFYGRWPDWKCLGWVAVVNIALFLMSFWIFGRLQQAVAEEI